MVFGIWHFADDNECLLERNFNIHVNNVFAIFVTIKCLHKIIVKGMKLKLQMLSFIKKGSSDYITTFNIFVVAFFFLPTSKPSNLLPIPPGFQILGTMIISRLWQILYNQENLMRKSRNLSVKKINIIDKGNLLPNQVMIILKSFFKGCEFFYFKTKPVLPNRWTVLLCTQMYTAVQLDTNYTHLSLSTCTVKQLNCTNPDLSNPAVDNLNQWFTHVSNRF